MVLDGRLILCPHGFRQAITRHREGRASTSRHDANGSRSALQAGGRGFESPSAHTKPQVRGSQIGRSRNRAWLSIHRGLLPPPSLWSFASTDPWEAGRARGVGPWSSPMARCGRGRRSLTWLARTRVPPVVRTPGELHRRSDVADVRTAPTTASTRKHRSRVIALSFSQASMPKRSSPPRASWARGTGRGRRRSLSSPR